MAKTARDADKNVYHIICYLSIRATYKASLFAICVSHEIPEDNMYIFS